MDCLPAAQLQQVESGGKPVIPSEVHSFESIFTENRKAEKYLLASKNELSKKGGKISKEQTEA